VFTPSRRYTLIFVSATWFLLSEATSAAERRFFDALSTTLGASLMNLDFKEFDQQDDRLVRESGWLPGVEAGLAARKHRAQARFRVSHYRGDVDYDGQTQSGVQIDSTTDEKIWDFSASAAYRLSSPIPPELYLYAGAGYRHWNRDIQSVRFVSGLDETYSWWSYHAGLEIHWQKGANHWSLDGRLSRTLNPEVKIDFLDAFDSATLDLGERWGWRTELQWTRMFSQQLSGGLRLFYQSLDLGKSDVETLTRNGFPVGTVFQPRSESRNYGVTLELRHGW